MRIFQYISIFFLVSSIIFVIYRSSPHYQIIKGEIYGTYYNIKINTDNKNKRLKDEIKEKLQDIDNIMSVFNVDSEISKLNIISANKTVKLSQDLSKILKTSHKVWQQSNGWFDPTLGNLINLWGFGTTKAKIPSDNEIKKVMQTTGFNKLKFKENYTKVYKTNKDTYINLSAIAKGFAVDEIALLLDNAGYDNYIVDIGGEVKTKGYRSKKSEAWNVAINTPKENSNENVMVMSLSNISVATSGNYRNYYKKDNKTYAHTISPKTGKPVNSDILSVSVFHDSCMYADAYATAINAMGLDKGLKFANKNNIKAIIFDNNLRTIYTESAKKMVE